MKDVYVFNKIIYNGNIDRDFYLYCCKQNKKLYIYILMHIFSYVLGLVSNKALLAYRKNYHIYLKNLKNIDSIIKSFKEKHKHKLNNWYLENRYHKNNIIISYSPDIITKEFLKDEKLISYTFTKDYKLDIINFNNQVNDLNKEYNSFYCNLYEEVNMIKAKYKFIKKRNIFIQYNNKKSHIILKKLLKLVLPILLAILLLMISFSFTTVYLDKTMIINYLHEPKLLILNIFPIIIALYLLLFLTKRLWISFSLTSLMVFVIGIINKTKLYYRDDVFKFEDITLYKEALIMTSRYDIIVRWYTVVCILGCLVIALLLKKYYKKLNTKWFINIPVVIVLLIFSGVSYQKTYTNATLYNSVGNKSNINIWISTRQSQVRGLIYPFIYSSTELITTKPDNYSKKEAEEILSRYKYENIPEDKKVNVIAIMLEAYNDFSKFDSIEFTDNVYEKLDEIKKDSLSGNIIVDIFGGGTVNTERHFITGYYKFPSFRKSTNSYARYFKEQGYVVEAMHPIYGAFYNRNTANNSIGFDKYWNFEERFKKYHGWGGFASDSELYSELINDLQETNKNGNNYFNFTVTYQNHGPYSTAPLNETYIKNKNYSNNAYNMFNRYLSGIKGTNEALYDLVKFLDNYEEPTILIFFGDHNPYLGENSYVYRELGINLNLSSEEGFENYYGIPYVIHANDSAKKVYGKDFKGELDTISPNFIMNELFEYIGLNGNEYLQYTSDIKKNVNVLGNIYYKENNKYVAVNESNNKDLINEFLRVNYYWANDKKINSK